MEIIWTSKARISFFNVLEYLEANWSIKETVQFYHRANLIIGAIQKNPGIFPASLKFKAVRKAVIDRNNSFFYRIDNYNHKIYILTFIDNRQDPKKLKL